MDQRTTDPDQNLERTGNELEKRLDHLGDDIDDARKEASARSQENEDPFENAAGDWEDTDDDAGGEDPEAFDDPERDEEDEDEDF